MAQSPPQITAWSPKNVKNTCAIRASDFVWKDGVTNFCRLIDYLNSWEFVLLPKLLCGVERCQLLDYSARSCQYFSLSMIHNKSFNTKRRNWFGSVFSGSLIFPRALSGTWNREGISVWWRSSDQINSAMSMMSMSVEPRIDKWGAKRSGPKWNRVVEPLPN